MIELQYKSYVTPYNALSGPDAVQKREFRDLGDIASYSYIRDVSFFGPSSCLLLSFFCPFLQKGVLPFQ